MKTNTTEITNVGKIKIVFIALLFIFSYFVTPNNTFASETFGAFAPKVVYVDNTTTAASGCASNQASIEFWLVEKNSETTITNSIANWSINVRRNSSDPVKIDGRNISGNKKSSVICFDPLENGFQIIVDASTDYQKLITPSIFPNTANLSALTDMIGNHFKGFIQLDKKSSTPALGEALTPDTNNYDTDPTFSVKTNYLPNNYGVSDLNLTRIYVINQANNNLYTNSINTIGGVGTRLLPGPSSLPEGRYYWTFHQEFNGKNTTQKLTPPATEWTFSNIPTSGTPDPLSFTIDKSDPTSNLSGFAITKVSTSTNSATLSFTNSLTDTYSGLSYSTLYVENISTASPVTEYIITRNFPANTNASSTVFSLSGLLKGNTYRFYTKTADNVGHIFTSSYSTYTIPLYFSVPVVKLYHATTSSIRLGVGAIYNSAFYAHATITDAHSNILPVIDKAVCWSTSTASLATTSIFGTASCKKYNLSYDPQNRYYNYFVGIGLNSSTTYYFRMLAQNTEGWGYSELGSTTTKPNPFGDASSTPSVPVVQYWAPSLITPTTLDSAVFISSAGNLPIDQYGLCYSIDSAEISAMDPSQLSTPAYWSLWSSRCKLFGPLPTTTSLSYISRSNNPYTFTGLTSNTAHYFKVFAINSFAVGTAIGVSTTTKLDYGFRNFNSVTYGISPRVVLKNADFDPVNEIYKKIEVQIAAFDNSYDCCSYPGNRIVDYKVDLDIGNNLSVNDTILGSISLDKSSTTPTFKSVYFYDVPLGEIKVTANINEPISATYPQDTLYPYKQNSAVITLNNPNLLIDEISGVDVSTSTDIVLDPKLNLKIDKPVVRIGQSTTLNWSMENTTIPFDCKIYGPSSFGVGGVYSFSHSFITGTTTDAGSVTTGELNNTQIFKFECVYTLDNSQLFSTTTRATVIGLPREI